MVYGEPVTAGKKPRPVSGRMAGPGETPRHWQQDRIRFHAALSEKGDTVTHDYEIPVDVDAERELLGSMTVPGCPVGEVLEILPPACGPWFCLPEHRVIFDTVCDLHHDGEEMVLSVLKNELLRAGQLEQIGGIGYLVELNQAVASSAAATSVARICREFELRRRALRAGLSIAEAASRPGRVEALADTVRAATAGIAWNLDAGGASTLSASDEVAIEEALNRPPGEPAGLSTGLRAVDGMLHGLGAGQLIVIGGRPGAGKSALMGCIADHIAVDLGWPVAYFSLEMSRLELWLRMACARTRVSFSNARGGRTTADEKARIREAVQQLREAPLYIDESQKLGLDGLLSRARALVADKGIEAIFVDYLQLLKGERRDNRQEEVAGISRSLKCFAHEHGLPVVVGVQLNRQTRGPRGSQAATVRHPRVGGDRAGRGHRDVVAPRRTLRRRRGPG